MIATGKNIIAIIESNMDEMTELEQEIAPISRNWILLIRFNIGVHYSHSSRFHHQHPHDSLKNAVSQVIENLFPPIKKITSICKNISTIFSVA